MADSAVPPPQPRGTTMPGTTPSGATLVERVASRRCAKLAFACLLVVVTASCFPGNANDAATGPSGGGGGSSFVFRPPAPPPSGNGKAPTETDTVAITAHPESPGFTIPTGFVGLSFEITDAINNPRISDPTLVRFLQNL